MHHSHHLDGRLEINGLLVSHRISVYFAGGDETVLSDANDRWSRIKLHLRPFSKRLLQANAASMKAGFFYEIRGSDVGACLEGPIGHPGDGEYDHRPLTCFKVHSVYRPNGLTVTIDCQTGEGSSGFERYADKRLAPWSFQITLFISRPEIKDFFHLTDTNYPIFEKTLDSCA